MDSDSANPQCRAKITRKTDPCFISDESMVRLPNDSPDGTRFTRRRIKRALAVRILLWASLSLPVLALIFVLRGCT